MRQSIQMPSRPVVVFSDSATPNWKEDQCKDPKTKTSLDEKEKTLLEAYQGGHYEELICNLNKGEVRRWGDLHQHKDILSNYKIAGIQLFQHSSHEAYKCMGPYVKDWQCCRSLLHPLFFTLSPLPCSFSSFLFPLSISTSVLCFLFSSLLLSSSS